MKTIIFLNARAGAGRVTRRFEALAPVLRERFGDYRLVITAQAAEVEAHLSSAAGEGYDTVIAVGGDGTNRVLVNAMRQTGHDFIFGTLPLGTGADWARGLGMPADPQAAARWLARAQVRPVDLGRVTIDGESSLFLNVAGTGLSGEVSRRVNSAKARRPWSYLLATVGALLQSSPPRMHVSLDGQAWYEGDACLLAVGNGRIFGRGMQICPNAIINDGLFDVVLVEGKSKLELLPALPTLFKGTHIERDDVHVRRARHVLVEALGAALDVDMDGESGRGRRVEFDILPGALPMLVDPSAEVIAG
jgi:diacylglycerol kinase (ATP)